MNKKTKIYTTTRPVYKFFAPLVKLFKRKPKIFNLNTEPFKEPCIIISNHSGASGPLTMALYYPQFFIPWGTHAMTGRYKARWNYLYHVFYQQKLGYRKFRSFILATSFGIVSKMLYNGMQLIPTYEDLRFKDTINLSVAHLNNGSNILVFPEDSNNGYHENLLSYHSGFVFLWQEYFKRTEIDLPIYPVYYHKRKGAMVIGPKTYITPLIADGLSRDQIAEFFKNLTNDLRIELFEKLKQKQ